MSTSDRNAEIKSYFQRGDIPTQEDFGQLVDAATTDLIANERLQDEINLMRDGKTTSVSATNIVGNGSQLTNLDADQLSVGTVNNARLPEQVDLTQIGADSKVTAKAIVGDGAQVTNLANEHLPKQINLTTATGSGEASLIAEQISATRVNASYLNGDGTQVTNLANEHLPKQINLTVATGSGEASLTAEQISATRVNASYLNGDGTQVTNLANDNLPKQIDLTTATGEGIASLTTEQLTATTVNATSLVGDGTQVTNLANENLPKQIDLTTVIGTGTASLTAEDVYATRLTGDGSQVTGLDVSNLSGGKIDNSLLNEASQSTLGIAKFATASDLDSGTIDSVVSAGDLKSAFDSTRSYVDQELALLQAGIKFKKEVATVFTDNYDLTAGVPTEAVNGHLIQAGDRVLFSAQDELAENKVWVAQADNTWLLAEDFDNTPEQELSAGISVEVLKGSVLEYSIWTVSEVSAVNTQVLLTWRKRNDVVNYQPGDGIVFDGLTIKGDQAWVEGVVQNTTINASSLQGEIASNQIASTLENKTFSGNGAGLTALNADNMTSGSLDITRLPSQLDFTQAGSVANSSVQAARFIGDGNALSNLDASNISMGQVAASLLAETGQNWDFDAWFARSLKAHLREMEVPFDFLDKYGFKDLTPVSHMGQYGTAQLLDYQYYTVQHNSGTCIIRERLGRWDLNFGQSGLLALPRPNNVYLYSFNNSLYAIEVSGARLSFYRQESSAIDGTLDLEQAAFFFDSAYVGKEHKIHALYHDVDYLYVHIEVVDAAPVESLVLRMDTQGAFASHPVNAQVNALFVGDGTLLRVLTENDVYDLDNSNFSPGVTSNLTATYSGMFNKAYLYSQIFYLEGGEGQISWTTGDKDSFFLSQNTNVKTDFSIPGISDTLTIHDFYIVKDRLVGIWFSTFVGQNYQHYFTVIDIVNNTLLASYNNGQPFAINHDLLFAIADQNHILLNAHSSSFRLTYLEQGNIMQVVNIPTA